MLMQPKTLNLKELIDMEINPNTPMPSKEGGPSLKIDPENKKFFDLALANSAPEFRAEPNPMFTKFPDQHFGIYQTNYERYARRSNFDELGFSPYRDNDAIYNAEANWVGELWRGIQGASMLAGSSAIDMFGGTVDIVTGNWGNLLTPDDKAAGDFQEINRLYGSTAGGATGFISNGVLNAGFIGGMIIGSLPESIVLGLATAEAGGAAGWANIGSKVLRGSAILNKLRRVGRVTQAAETVTTASSVLRAAETAQGASQIATWLTRNSPQISKIVNNPILKFINPLENTVGYLDDMAKAASVGAKLPSAAKGAGAVMRDMQIFKAAAVEASLEGGFVSNTLRDKYINQYYQENGKLPDEEELAFIQEKASEAGSRTVSWNLPVILFTDKLLFKPMLSKLDKTITRGIGKGMEGVVETSTGYVGRNVAGKTFRETIKLEGKTLAKSLLKPETYLTRGKNFFTAGIGEGTQEVFQEITSKTMESYYGDIISSPMHIPKAGIMGHLSETISEAGGDEAYAFASGMFIGGMFGAGSSKFATFIKASATKEGREKYQAFKEQRQKLNNELADTLNEAFANPLETFEKSIRTHEDAKKLIRQIGIGQALGDSKMVKDAIEELRFNKVFTALETQTFDALVGKLTALQTMDDAQLLEATGDTDAAEARERISKTIKRAEEIKKRFNQVKDKYPNPFDYSMYEYGTEAYNAAYISHKAHEEAVRDYIFLGDSIDNIKERRDAIRKNIGNSNVVPSITSLEADVLTSRSNLDKEISLLSDEILAEGAASTPAQKKIIANKKARLEVLKNYREKLKAFHEAESAGKGTKRKKQALRKAFDAVAKHLNSVSGVESTASEEAIAELFDGIVDYQRLDIESLYLSRHLTALDSPAALMDYSKRHAAAMMDVFVNKKKHIARSIERFAEVATQNQIMHDLKEAGYAFKEEDLIDYLNEGKLPSELISLESGEIVSVSEEKVKEVFDQILKPHSDNIKEKIAEQEAEAQRKEAEAAKKKAAEESKETEPARRNRAASETLSQMSAVQMDNPQTYKELVSSTPEVAELLTEFLNATNDPRDAVDFIASSEGALFMAFIKKAIEAKATSSFAGESLARYLGSQEALNSPTVNEAFESFYKGEKYPTFTSLIEKMAPVSVIEDWESELNNEYYKVEVIERYPDQDVYIVSSVNIADYPEGEVPDTEYYAINSRQEAIPQIHPESKVYTDLALIKDAVNEFLNTGKVSKGKRFAFDGQVLRPGAIIVNSNGTRYEVVGVAETNSQGKPSAIKIQKANSKNRPEVIRSLANYSLESNLRVADDASRLSPYEFGWIKRPNNVTPDHNVKLSKHYNSVTEEEFLESLSFEVSTPVSTDVTESNLAIKGRPENTRIKKRSADRGAVSVYVTNQQGEKLLLGYLNDPTEYVFYAADGTRVGNLQQHLVDSDTFDLSRSGLTAEKVFAQYTDALNLYNYLVGKRGSQSSVIVPFAEVNAVTNLQLSKPSFLFDEDVKVPYEQLNYKTYMGRTVVIDRFNNNELSIFGDSLDFDQLNVLEAIIKNSKSSYENLGRYILVSQLPNGRIIFTELSSQQLSEEKLQGVISKLGGNNFNEEEFNNSFFFAYTGKDVYGGGNANIRYNVTFSMTEEGRVKVSFLPLNGTVTSAQNIYFDFSPSGSVEEFFTAFNEAIAANNVELDKSENLKYVKLDENMSAANFFENLPKKLTEADLNKTKSNVSDPEMVAVSGIKISGSFGTSDVGPSIEAMQNTPAPATVAAEAEAVVVQDAVTEQLDSKITEDQQLLLVLEQELDTIKRDITVEDILENEALAQQVQALEDQIVEVKQRLNIAYKTLDSYTPADAEELVQFLAWAETSLPEFIKIATVETIADRMISEGITVGRFATIVKTAAKNVEDLEGVIEILEDSPAKYHEAFHAVFRMLLTDADIQRALQEGALELRAELRKKGMTIAQAMTEYRNQPFYARMNDAELFERMIEEHLADKFEEFKKNPKNVKTAVTNKSLFRKIIDFLINFFKHYRPTFKSNDELFEGISSGKFRKAGIQDNKYTRQSLNNGGDTAFAVMLSKGSARVATASGVEVIPQYINAQDAQYLLSGIIAKAYNDRQTAGREVSTKQLVNAAIIDFSRLFNPDRYSDPELKERAAGIQSALKSPANLKEIYNHVTETFRSFDNVRTLLDDVEEDIEENIGGNSSKSFFQNKEEIDGLKSLPGALRALISTTPVKEADVFGNEFFVDREGKLTEERIIVPASIQFVYNAVSRITADSVDEIEMLNRLHAFSKLNSSSARNSHTVQFINHMFKVLNIVPTEDGLITEESITAVKNPRAYQAFVKTFEKSKRSYRFTAFDRGAKEKRSYDADRQSEGATQYDIWRAAFNSKASTITEETAAEAQDIMSKLVSIMDNLAVYDEKVSKNVTDLLTRFGEITGIEIVPSYVEYSWYKYKIANSKLEVGSADQNMLSVVRQLSLPVLTPDVLKQIGKSLEASQGRDLFLRDDSEEAINEAQYGVGGRIRSLASGNVFFNESIDTTSFNNANGKKIQTYQPKNVLTKLVQQLTKGIPTDEYLEDNFLLNNEDFLKIISTLTTESIDGVAARSLSNKGVSFNRQAGNVFADFSNRELAWQLLSQYTDVTVTNGVVTVPHLIKVMAEASTGMTVNLPPVKAVELTTAGYKIASSYIQAIVNEIQRDLRAIDKAQAEIEKLERGGDIDFDVVEGYHNGEKRGLKLSLNMRALLGKEFSERLERGESISEAEYTKHIDASLRAAFDKYVNFLIKNDLLQIRNGIFEMGVDNPLITILGGANLKKGVVGQNLKTLNLFPKENKDTSELGGLKLQASLAQIFFSTFLVTSSFNQVILGEHNKQFKNGTAVVKRGKGLNSAGISVSHSITAPSLGVTKPFSKKGDLINITFPDLEEDGITVDDGQCYMTVNGLRHILLGAGGRLTERWARVLNKLERGQSLTDDEVFGPGGTIEYNEQTNSLKLVYYDGRTFLKMSVALLTPEFTLKHGGQGTFLDNLRRVLETAERNNLGAVALGHPKSASKTEIKNMVQSREDIDPTNESLFENNFNQLDPNFLYLSTENPSNKTTVRDVTQIRSILVAGYEEGDTVFVNGVETPVEEAIAEMWDIYASNVADRYFDKREATFTIEDVNREFAASRKAGKVTPKLEEFRREAVEILKQIGASSQEIELFERQDVNLNNPVTLSRFYGLFLSTFSKAIGNDLMPGYKLTLQSDAGVRVRRIQNTAVENGTSVDTVVTEEQYAAMNNAEKALVYDDRLRHDVKTFDANGNVIETYSEMLMPAHFMGASLDFENIMHSVRVPSQSDASGHNIKVVGNMPAYYGSQAILPRELIKITGWDFDIDSIFVHRPLTYAGGKIYGQEKTLNERKEAYYNSLIKNNSAYRNKLNEFEIPSDRDMYMLLLEAISQELGVEYSEDLYKAMPEYRMNRILAIKTGLQGSARKTTSSTGDTPIGYRSMTTDHYDNFGEKIKEEAPAFAGFIESEDVMHDSMNAQVEAFGNIREGADNIGPAVNGVLGYSLLNKNGVSSDADSDAGVKINGRIYSSFTALEDTDGNLISDNLSQTVSIMVDNPSNPVARMYGLSLEQTGVVAYLNSLGMTIEDALIFINQPVVRYITESLQNAGSAIKSGKDSARNEEKIYKDLYKKFKEVLGEDYPELEELKGEGASISIENLEENTTPFNQHFEKGNESFLLNQLAVLVQFKRASQQSKIFSDYVSLTKLSRGIGKTVEDFDRYLDRADMFTKEDRIEELRVAGFPTNNLKASINNNAYLKNQIAAIRELSVLMKSIFIDRSAAFSFVEQALETSLTSTGYIKKEALARLKKDLLSAITATAYMNSLEEGDRRALNLKNSLIYESLKSTSPGSSDITEIVAKLRRHYSEKGQRNRLIQDYLLVNPATKSDGTVNTRNREQLNRISLNSWSQLSPEISDQLYRDFVDGLTSTDELEDGTSVRSAFIDLVHYLLVKDGLTFRSNSFLAQIPAIALKEIFASNNKAIEVLKDAEGMLLQSTEVFGTSLDRVLGDFLLNWSRHRSNNNYIHTFRTPQFEKDSVQKEFLDKMIAHPKSNGQVLEDLLDINFFGWSEKVSQEEDTEEDQSDNFTEDFKTAFQVFRASGIKTVKLSNGTTRTSFPLFMKDSKGQLWKLDYYYGSVEGSDFFTKGKKIRVNESNVVGIMQQSKRELGQPGFFGSQARYEKVTQKGNTSQTGSGYVFGELPDYQLLEVKKVSTTGATDSGQPTGRAVSKKAEDQAVETADNLKNQVDEASDASDKEVAEGLKMADTRESNMPTRRGRSVVPKSLPDTLSGYQLTKEDVDALRNVYESKAFAMTSQSDITISDFQTLLDLVEETLQVNKEIKNIDDLVDDLNTCYNLNINL